MKKNNNKTKHVTIKYEHSLGGKYEIRIEFLGAGDGVVNRAYADRTGFHILYNLRKTDNHVRRIYYLPEKK